MLILFSICQNHPILGQDSLSLEDMQKFAFPFTIQNEEFIGKGGEVLTQAIANAHITMLGDNNLSKLEYEFTEALIKELDRNAYKRMVMEVGPSSANIINHLSSDTDLIVDSFKALNRKYGLAKKEKLFVPIPEFKSIEAAQYLQTAKEKNWSVWGIGPASWISYSMLVDELFNNLSTAHQIKHQATYSAVKAFLADLYANIPKQTSEELAKFTAAIKSSESFNKYLSEMAEYDNNLELIIELKYSLAHWSLYGQKDFYKENKIHVQKSKAEVANILNNNNFDFKKDKLFIKMWVNYLAKGTNISGFYGVGNMLQEMAAYHGNNSINIAIARRYYEENGVIKDILAAKNPYLNFKELIPLGKKEEWILIDLRPFHKTFFWKGVKMSLPMNKIIRRYDFLVIPSTDTVATKNY